MKKTIKYLDNDGNYQYATVKDAGDLDKLKTKAKEDLVSAINELATNGIGSGGVEEVKDRINQIQKQVDENSKNLDMNGQERQEMQQELQRTTQELNRQIAEIQAGAAEQTKKLNDASAELKKKADAIDVQKMQQDNAEALKNSTKALEDSLAATNEDLQKTADHLNEMEIQAGVVETSVKELQNGFESRVSSADFNEARTKLQEQETMVRQLNNELSTKASNNELDMVTQRVQKAESNIQQNAQGIKASVTKETMYKEMDDFAKYRENRLKYSRDFSNDWVLNGNDILDDDHLFDVQHDVKSVSIRNGAYLTQTTDLNVDDMSKTFTMAMWVEKGKKPRVWYGSNELTNMKVKEDKGDYQRVYWTFAPTIVKQDIRITGDSTTQGNLIISEPKLEQSDRPSAWSTNTGDQYATTEKLAHDLKLTSDKLESTITKQSEFSDRQLQDESRITQTEHGLEVANKTIVSKTDGLRQEFDGKMDATSKSLTTEYQSFTNRAIGQMADGGSNLILNSSFGNLKNSYDKWTNVSPKVRIVEDDNGLKWAKMEQSGLTADSPIGLTSNLFRVKKGIVTVALDIRTDNPQAIDNDNITILESYNADQKRVFTQEVGFSAFKITKETLSDHGPHRVIYKYNQTRDDTQYMAVHIVLPKNGVLYVTNVLARTVANGEDSGEYAPNAADLHEQVVQQRTRIEQSDQAIALKADRTTVAEDISQAKAELNVRADGIVQNVTNLTKSQEAVTQRVANVETKSDEIKTTINSVTNDLKNGKNTLREGIMSMADDHFSTKFSSIDNKIDGISVGGTNLLLNTKDFTGDWYQRGSANLQDLDGRKVIHAWADWSSYRTRQVIQLEQNTDYTISADIRSLDGNSSDNTVTIHGVLDGEDTQLGDLHTNGKLSSKQQRFSTVWHNTSAGQLTRFRLEGHGGWGAVHGSIYISHIKLEKGNKPTDWSPAPEDVQGQIDSVVSKQTEFQTSIDGVKSTVSTLSNNQASFTKFEQTDGGFKLVAGKQTLEFGGTNLLKNSDFQQGWANWSSHGSSSGISDSRPSGLPNYVKTVDFLSNTGSSQSALVQSHIGVKAGRDYMISFWAKADDATELCVESNAIRYQPKLTTSWQYYSGKVTFQTDDRELYIYPTSKTTWVHLAGIKLEQGNVATAWSPELVDKTTNLQTQITATNQALESKVGKGEVFSAINQTPDAIILTANDIELKSKTALKVGKITGKDLSMDLNTGEVLFKNGHIKGKNIDIDIANDTIKAPTITGGTINGSWIQAGTLASVTSQNTVTRSPISGRYNLQPVGVDKTHVIDRHGTMVNGNNMWEIHAGDNISTGTKTHAFFSLVANYGAKHPITSELNVERASPNGFEFLNTRSVYRFTTIQNRTRDYWTLVPIGTVLNVSAGAFDELILRYRLSIKNGGTKSDKIPLQLVFWPTTQTNRFTWNSDNTQLSYLQLGEINLNGGESPLYKFSELRHYASGSLAEYTDTLTLSKFGWGSIPSMGMAIALKFSGEATIDFDPIAFSITNSGNIATERGGSQNTYIDPLGNIDNVYANNKYNKILSLSQGGLKLSASDIDTKTSASAGDFILSMDGRTLSFTAHPDFARGPRIVFGGDGNDDGITMSSFGNIDGMTGAWAWKVRDAADRLRLQLPLAENKTGNDGAWMRFRDFTMDIEGAENKLKFTWWSNGGFYGGAKIPCLATENVFTGQGADGSGIGFANGQYVYFTRNKWRSVGI